MLIYERKYQKRKLVSKFSVILFFLSIVSLLIPLFVIVGHVLIKGASSLSFNFLFNSYNAADPHSSGIFHAIIGTMYIVGIGGLFAIPVGIVCGIYLSEFKNEKLSQNLKIVLNMLAGVPSIIVGIFAYLLLVVPLKSFSALAGAFSLSIIIIPIVAKTTEEILKTIPRTVREAAMGLGLTKTQVIFKIIIKGHISALATGALIAVSRAGGETAPLLFTAFGNLYLSTDIMGPMSSLPVQIYNFATSPYTEWQNQAWAGAFVLMMIVLLINILSRVVVRILEGANIKFLK